MTAHRRLAAVFGIACMLHVASSSAEEPRVTAESTTASFALVIGSNRALDSDLPTLKYADDDAARYFDLFRLVGARTYLLTRLDENTRRLHPQSAAEAEEPRRAQLDRAVAQLVADVGQANARGLETLVYIVFAGHGDVKNGQAYVMLEDARITGAELAQIAKRLPATRIHVVVDACASYFLAQSRGPGGERRALDEFRTAALTDDKRVGLLLSTSSARESHEWEGYQGGIFSHEVRSGLYGGADADGDGVVSYREIAAFVQRANAAVPNEKYRPDVYARAPRDSDKLLDLRRTTRRLVIDGAHAGHYFLEDARGIRLADVHNAPNQRVELLRPGPSAHAYLHRVDDDREFVVEPAPEVVALAELTPAESRSQTRGAAHEAFSLLFAQPFDAAAVAGFRESSAPRASETGESPSGFGTRRWLGLGALGLGAVGLGAGAFFAARGSAIGSRDSAHLSNAAAAGQNARVSRFGTSAIVSFAAGGVAAVSGLALLLWPSASPVRVGWTPAGLQIGTGGTF